MRNFKNFLDSYVEYATDNFCPPQFHKWTGLSILAGALERKVWLEQHLPHASVIHYPNIFVLLVSHPSVGKTTAMDRGVDLLERLRHEQNPEFKFISNQANEPSLVKSMQVVQALHVGNAIRHHSSGYFYAAEASASALQNTCGDFIATLTAFYDCPKWFRKTLVSTGTVEIQNLCFNVLAGSTFNYLKNLVNEESALGGFASRCIYVIAKDRKIRSPKWLREKPAPPVDGRMADRLLEDLKRIHGLIGTFKPTDGFIRRWEAWQPEFDHFLNDLDDDRLEAIHGRKGTNLTKLCMLMSVAERDDLVLTEEHWERALVLINEVTADNAYVLSSAIIANTDSQAGITELVKQTLREGGLVDVRDLRTAVLKQGSDITKFNTTLEFLKDAGEIGLVMKGGVSYYKLLPKAKADI